MTDRGISRKQFMKLCFLRMDRKAQKTKRNNPQINLTQIKLMEKKNIKKHVSKVNTMCHLKKLNSK